MQVPMFRPMVNYDVAVSELENVLQSGYIAEGEQVKKFERRLAATFKVPEVVATNSCTSALHLALRLAGVHHGHEVITTALTCSATNMPILATGAIPVWADVQEDLNISPASIFARITDNTRAIVVVHWGGYPCDMEAIMEIARNHNLPVIEDCAHAIHSYFDGDRIGTIGDFGCFSFQAIKHLTCGDGGMLICKNPLDTEAAKRMRWFGIPREEGRQSHVSADIYNWGWKFNMNDITASIGLANLERVHSWVIASQVHSYMYDSFLNEMMPDSVAHNPQPRFKGTRSSDWLFTMLVENRDDCIRALNDKGIEASIVHRRNDEYHVFTPYKQDLPMLDAIDKTRVCLPVGPHLSVEQIVYVTKALEAGW